MAEEAIVDHLSESSLTSAVVIIHQGTMCYLLGLANVHTVKCNKLTLLEKGEETDCLNISK